MSGGKGGSTTQTSQIEIPKWAQNSAKKNIAMGDYAAQLGYMPYYGLDVAAQSPAQQAANQNFGSAVSAFGGQAPVDMNAGMPQAQSMGGVMGYSSGDLFDSAVAELAQRRPAQYEAYSDMFIDPQTGKLGTLFTPNGSIGTSDAATRQVSDDQMDWLNYAIGKGPAEYENALGIPQNGVDWHTLPDWAKELTNWLIPGYGVIDTIKTAKDTYDAKQVAEAAQAKASASRKAAYNALSNSNQSGQWGSGVAGLTAEQKKGGAALDKAFGISGL